MKKSGIFYRSDKIKKWRDIYLEEDQTMIALLELEDANELSKEEKESLLSWSGDNEYAYINGNGELVYK